MKDLHFNVFKLITDATLGAKFNETYKNVDSVFWDDSTLNGVMIDVSDNNDNGIWDADCYVDIDKAELVVTGHQFCSGAGQAVYARIDRHGDVIETNHPTMTKDQLKLNTFHLTPTSAEIAMFLIKEFWDCLYSE